MSPIQNKSLYPILEHYTGSVITSVDATVHGNFMFNTKEGNTGFLIKDILGKNWLIQIDGESVDSIEKEVFDTLVNPDSKSTLEDYLDKLHILVLSDDVKYRSKVLVSKMSSILEEYILNSDFVPSKEIRIGTFSIFGFKNKRFTYCLN
jgi:hypothetical protein